MKINIVYQGMHGWVSDIGPGHVLQPLDADTAPAPMPRYGVWRTVNGRAQVVFTSDDLDAAKRRADSRE